MNGNLPAERKYKVFVSYRHADEHAAARIVDFLVAVLGKDAIFHDVRSIPAGADFRKSLLEAVAGSELVLAVIGPSWIESLSDKARAARGDEPDWVLLELEEAFNHDVRVIPAVIHPSKLPSREALPPSIQELAFRQARIVWPDLAFENSIHQLVDEVQVLLQGDLPGSRSHQTFQPTVPRKTRTRPGFWILASLLLGAGTLGGVAWWSNGAIQFRGEARASRRPPNEAHRAQIERRVRTIRATKSNPPKARLSNAIKLASLGTPDFSNFEILGDELVWDLRGFQQRAANEPPMTSYVVMTRRLRLVKTVECAELRTESRTTGTDLFLRSPSHPELSVEYYTDTPKTTGLDVMKVRQLAIDISAIPIGEEFSVTLESTYWDSLQTPEECWIGAQGFSQSDVIQFLVVFPDQMMFSECSLLSAPTRREVPTPFQGDCVFQADREHGYVFWEIPFAEVSRIYRLAWTW